VPPDLPLTIARRRAPRQSQLVLGSSAVQETEIAERLARIEAAVKRIEDFIALLRPLLSRLPRWMR
jgi:hypothetical protein